MTGCTAVDKNIDNSSPHNRLHYGTLDTAHIAFLAWPTLMNNRWLWAIVALCLVTWAWAYSEQLDAPGIMKPSQVTSVQALRDRVTAYWNARSRPDLAAAYPFYEPSFRAAYPLNEFLSEFQRLTRFRPVFEEIERIRVEPDGRTAVVHLRVRSRPDLLEGQELSSVSEEKWLLIDREWYQRENRSCRRSDSELGCLGCGLDSQHRAVDIVVA